MEDYKEIARKRYLERQHIIAVEKEKLQKILDEEKKKKDEEIKRKVEEENKKQEYITSQISIIDSSILTFETDKTDDNIMLILICIISCLENIIHIIDDIQKQNIIEKIMNFTIRIDETNLNRKKSINTISNVKMLGETFKKIYELLNMDVEIVTLDTEDDEYIAKNLSRPQHLAGAADAAILRAKK
jgi:hypothetical protein